MKIEIRRDGDEEHNWGKMFIDDVYFGETLEDPDRFLESGGTKVDGDTCIPRGTYDVTLTMSARFGRIMPEVHGVPEFSGVRIHGGNVEADTSGCPLLGAVRTETGVANCKGINDRLKERIAAAIEAGEKVTLEVL